MRRPFSGPDVIYPYLLQSDPKAAYATWLRQHGKENEKVWVGLHGDWCLSGVHAAFSMADQHHDASCATQNVWRRLEVFKSNVDFIHQYNAEHPTHQVCPGNLWHPHGSIQALWPLTAQIMCAA